MKQNVQSLLFKEISELCKAYKIKASQRYLTIYKRIDPLLWHAFIAKWAQSPEQIQFMAEVQIKPLDFDDIDAKITKPETVVKHSDFYRANPGYHSFEIEKKIYTFPTSKIMLMDGSFNEAALQEAAQSIFQDILETVTGFIQMVEEEYGDIYHFFIAKKDLLPLFAGLSYVHFGKYEEAGECFTIDAAHRKAGLCIGNPNRFFSQVCRDYCTVLASGRIWKQEYVVNGLPSKA